jgi:hypothetical protein
MLLSMTSHLLGTGPQALHSAALSEVLGVVTGLCAEYL